MKRKNLTILLSMLTLISLISVGFAAWVISAGDTAEMNGNIQVETVEDNRVDIIDSTLALSSESFIFGKDKTSVESPWLVNTSVAEEVLSVTLTFTVDNHALAEDVKENTTNTLVTAKFDIFTETTQDDEKIITSKLNDAVNAGYIQAVNPSTDVIVAMNGDSFTVTVTLKWGALFNNKNPYVFYNAEGMNDTLKVDANGIPSVDGTETTYVQHALTYMNAMDTFFDGVKFSIVVTASQPTT